MFIKYGVQVNVTTAMLRMYGVYFLCYFLRLIFFLLTGMLHVHVSPDLCM